MSFIKAAFIIITALLCLLWVSPAVAFDPFGNVCQNGNNSNSSTCQANSDQKKAGTNPVIKTIRTAANILAVVAGVAAVITVIISGFMFVTAGGAAPGQRSGDPNRIKTARATLTGAIIGLIIIALAWTIITFVTDRIIG